MLTHECKGNASYKHLSIKQENIDLYYKNKPRIFATVPEIYDFYHLANSFLLENIEVNNGNAVLIKGKELLSNQLIDDVRIQTLFVLAAVSEKMSIKEELDFLDEIISLNLTDDSFLKAMLHKANYYMRNEKLELGYNEGVSLVGESINRNNEFYLMQGREFLGKYFFNIKNTMKQLKHMQKCATLRKN